MTNSQDTLVFRADNAHAPDSGEPPHIVNGQADLYYGYFENDRGEQWVLIVDRDTKRGVLRSGHFGWAQQYEVKDGRPDDIVLGRSEREWLKACWHAATRTEA